MTVKRVLMAVSVVLGVFGAGATPALASSPWWHLTSNVKPAILHEHGTIVAQAVNVGDAATLGDEGASTAPIVLTDTLPEGVSVDKVEPEAGEPEPKVSFTAQAATPGLGAHEELRFQGPGFGPTQELAFEHACTEPAVRVVRCVYPEGFAVLAPFEFIEMGIAVSSEANAVTGTSHVEVSGGGAAPVQIERPLPIGNAAPSFGIEEFTAVPESEGGRVDAQAGSHPYQFTTTVALNQSADPLRPPGLARSLAFELPAGLVGNASAVAQCSEAQFTQLHGGIVDLCPEDTAIGVATLTIDEPVFGGVQTISIPLFNLTPGRGEPARFGFEYVGTPVILDPSVRTGSDYGVTVTASNFTQVANAIASTVTFWGVPGAPSHDQSRGWGCLAGHHWAEQAGLSCKLLEETGPRPFLTLPSSCAQPFAVSVTGSAWPTKEDPAGPRFPAPGEPPPTYSLKDAFGQPLGITGCDALSFDPSIEVAPDGQDASTATGLDVKVHVPQESGEGALGLSPSDVKDITVALPEGRRDQPVRRGRLEACAEGQVGFEDARGVGGFEELDPGVNRGSGRRCSARLCRNRSRRG